MANVKKFVYITTAAKWEENKQYITSAEGKWFKSIVFRADTNELYNRGKVFGLSVADAQRITDLESAIAALETAQLAVASDDKVLTITDGATEGTKEVKAHLSINYDSETRHIQLKGKQDAEGNAQLISEFDATAFIHDGMVESAELVTEAEEGVTVEVPYIKLTFNTDVEGHATHDVVRFSVKSLVDLYDAANINLTDGYNVPESFTPENIVSGASVETAIGELVAAHNAVNARIDEVESVTAASLNDLNTRLMNETDWEEL